MGRICCYILPPNKKILWCFDTKCFVFTMLVLSSIYSLVFLILGRIFIQYIGPILIATILFNIAFFVFIVTKKKEFYSWGIIIDGMRLIGMTIIYLIYFLFLHALVPYESDVDFNAALLMGISSILQVILNIALNQYDSSFNLYEETTHQNPEEYQSMNTVNNA